MARVLKGSHSFTCTQHTHTFIRNRNELYLPLPSQPQLVLIYRPGRDGRLSWQCTHTTYRTSLQPAATSISLFTHFSLHVLLHWKLMLMLSSSYLTSLLHNYHVWNEGFATQCANECQIVRMCIAQQVLPDATDCFHVVIQQPARSTWKINLFSIVFITANQRVNCNRFYHVWAWLCMHSTILLW